MALLVREPGRGVEACSACRHVARPCRSPRPARAWRCRGAPLPPRRACRRAARAAPARRPPRAAGVPVERSSSCAMIATTRGARSPRARPPRRLHTGSGQPGRSRAGRSRRPRHRCSDPLHGSRLPGAGRDYRERHVEHPLERLHGHALVRLVVALGPVRDVDHGSPAAISTLASLPPPVSMYDGSRPRPRARRPQPPRQARCAAACIRGTGARPPSRRRTPRRPRPRGGVHQLLDDLRGARVVEAAGLEHDLGSARPPRWRRCRPRSGRRWRWSRGRAGRCCMSRYRLCRRRRWRCGRPLAGCRRGRPCPLKVVSSRVVGGRGGDQLADRGWRGRRRSRTRTMEACRESNAFAPCGARSSQVVKRISTPGRAGLPCAVSRRAAARIVATAALLSAPRMASCLLCEDAVLLVHLDGPVRGTVSRWAQTGSSPSGGPFDAGEQVAGVGAGLGGGAVLLDGEAELLKIGPDRVGDLALVLRRALDLAEPHEVVEQPLALGRGSALKGRGHSRAGGYPWTLRLGPDRGLYLGSPFAGAARGPRRRIP